MNNYNALYRLSLGPPGWINLFFGTQGTFLVSQSAAQHMVESEVRNGSIVNMASIVGKVGGVDCVCTCVCSLWLHNSKDSC